jgi:hypothetical protein
MEFIDWIVYACIFVAGYGVKGAVEESRKPQWKWSCPHCPLKIAASDKEGRDYAQREHLTKTHPGIHS